MDPLIFTLLRAFLFFTIVGALVRALFGAAIRPKILLAVGALLLFGIISVPQLEHGMIVVTEFFFRLFLDLFESLVMGG